MGSNRNIARPDHSEAAPVAADTRYDKLEERVRKIEADINKATGVLNVLRWLGPSLLIVLGGIAIFILGRSFPAA